MNTNIINGAVNDQMKHIKNYFYIAFLTLFLSVGTFYAFKTLLPEGLFKKTAPVYDDIPATTEPAETYADDTIAVDDTAAVEYAPFDGLVRFFHKLFTLEKTKKGSVRIAYFGDSMIECDKMVLDVRKGYQNKFGGQGIGFVPFSGLSRFFSGSIQYEYSPKWETYCDFCSKKSSPDSLGISGFVSFAKPGVWTSYQSGSLPLVHPTFFYGQSSNNDAKMIITADSGVVDSVRLTPLEILNKHSLAFSPKELKIKFDNADSIPFYGVNFSEGNGVNVDDFALRGNSGLPLGKFDMALMNAFHREFGYDLIILQFGMNILKLKPGPYDWYESGMTEVVNHIRKCFPGADILIVSVADKATKYGTEMRTDTKLTKLIETQERYARNTRSAFINMFQMMGGKGSIVRWVHETPPAAWSDYIHFTAKGSKRMGNLIFEKLDQEYENFKMKNNLYVEKSENE